MNDAIGAIRERGAWLLAIAPGFLSIGIARLQTQVFSLSWDELVLLSFILSLAYGAIALLAVNIAAIIRIQPITLAAAIRSPLFLIVLLGAVVAGGVAMAAKLDDDSLFSFGVTEGRSLHEPLEYLARRSNGKGAESTRSILPDLRADSLDSTRIEKNSRNQDALVQDRMVVRVRIDGGPTYRGFVSERNLLDGPRGGSMYLTPACREDDGSASPLDGPGVWLPQDKLLFVEFLDFSEQSTPCVFAQAVGQPTSP